MFGRKMLSLFLLCGVLSTHALGQVYTWVDEKGQKHFGSQPPASQQRAEPVSITQGYVGEGRAASPVAPESSASGAAPEKKMSRREMCQSAMRWTVIDLENLREMAVERRDAGRITAAEYAQGQKNIAGVEKRISMQDCITSSGEDQQRYECLSRGAGVMVCSGLAAAAMDEAAQKAKELAERR